MALLDKRRRYTKKATSTPILGLNWLKFTAIDSGTFSIKIYRMADISSISYSLDDGLTWTTTNKPANTEITVTTPTIASGDSVLWKGIGTSYSGSGSSEYETSRFSSTGLFDISGNIMSLLYGDNFEDKTSLQSINTFWYLFGFTRIVSAENLLLPAITLSTNCYRSMFVYCTNLVSAPELPATKLADYCYCAMFETCSSLTSHGFTPYALGVSCCESMYYGCTALSTFNGNLSATLKDSCYAYMFSGCTSLTTIAYLFVNTPAANCCEHMFFGCTSLNNISTNIGLYKSNAKYCYAYMFSNCSSLTSPPLITNSALADYCYQGMFFGCTSLTTAPALPQTALKKGCYSVMFFRCTSLTKAPDLPATTLVSTCYANMFNGCSNLNYIKAMFNTIPGTSYTLNWVKDVAASGTFVKRNSASWNVSGNNGIPSGWTVQTASS